jgi:L-ascorbate metabolism protein UlaG (beta-lactamase superfamily)
MNISWLGHSCFEIREKIDGKEVVVVTDPYNKDTGLFPPKLKADVVTISHHHFDHDFLEKVSGNNEDKFQVFDNPGEYETKKVFLTGIMSAHDKNEGDKLGFNTIFRIEMEDMIVVHLGDLGAKLTEKQVEEIGEVDVLLVPVGGKYTLNGNEAAEVVRQIEPRLVIPMHYKIPGLTIDIGDEKAFIKEMGNKAESLPRLKITRKDLPEDNIRVVVLEKE